MSGKKVYLEQNGEQKYVQQMVTTAAKIQWSL